MAKYARTCFLTCALAVMFATFAFPHLAIAANPVFIGTNNQANVWEPYNAAIDQVNGKIYIVGPIGDAANYDWDWRIAKLNVDGTTDSAGWPIIVPGYNGIGLQAGITGVAVDSLSNVVVCGSRNFDPNSGAADWFVQKYSGAGALLFSSVYNAPYTPGPVASPVDVATASNGNVYVVGYDAQDGVMNVRWVVIKYNSSLVPQWTWTFPTTSTSNNGASAVIVDSAGNPIVAGWQTTPSGEGWTVYKIDGNAKTPSVLWNWTPNSGGRPTDLAIDCNDNVYVAGDVNDPFIGRVWETIKISPSGAQMWDMREPSIGGVNANLYGVTYDKLNDYVVVAGRAELAIGMKGYAVAYNAGNANPAMSGSKMYMLDGFSQGGFECRPIKPMADTCGNIYIAGSRTDNLTWTNYWDLWRYGSGSPCGYTPCVPLVVPPPGKTPSFDAVLSGQCNKNCTKCSVKMSFKNLTAGTVKIYNQVTGVLVNTITWDGKPSMDWNLKDNSGMCLPTGVYLLNFDGPELKVGVGIAIP